MPVKIEFEPEPNQRHADRMPQWLPGEQSGAVAMIDTQQVDLGDARLRQGERPLVPA